MIMNVKNCLENILVLFQTNLVSRDSVVVEWQSTMHWDVDSIPMTGDWMFFVRGWKNVGGLLIWLYTVKANKKWNSFSILSFTVLPKIPNPLPLKKISISSLAQHLFLVYFLFNTCAFLFYQMCKKLSTISVR